MGFEPRLEALRKEIAGIRPAGNFFCANRAWIEGGYKQNIQKLVGWGRKGGPIELTTSGAYETACRKLYYQLPECRNCGCP